MSGKDNQYDIAILGSGIAGSLIGTILARYGARVLLIDAGTHPRFAVGESTVRHTFRMMKIMGERFDIPEVRHCSSGENIRKYVTSGCGEKRNFGFVYHRPGQEQIPEESTQLRIPPFLEGYEAHLFRQDIDPYLMYAAVRYGAELQLNTKIEDITFDDQCVTLGSTAGETFTASFVVDASGFRSPIAEKFNLRSAPDRLKTHSRSIFTHMIDVEDYDELYPPGTYGMPEKWYNGTCHHIFDGGWLWVIPFDNHPKSTNPLVSIGLSLDSRLYPKPSYSPQQEWEEFLDRFPSIKKQFVRAQVVRPWVSTGRLQYSSKQTIGDRFCLLAHAALNIDATFSRGLANTTEAINALAPLLLAAVKDDDFRAERFEYIERLQQNTIENNDKLVHGAYVSFRDFDLWNAWFRIWALGVGIGDLRLAGIYRKFKETHDLSVLPDAEEPMGLFCSNHKGFKVLFDKADAIVDKVEAGELDPKVASAQIFALVREVDYTAPAIGLADPTHRGINAGEPLTLLRSAVWGMREAPPEIKQHLGGAVGGLIKNIKVSNVLGRRKEEQSPAAVRTV
ncbi:MAG: NAD(P)/FAD-dependent oxidoreductase [Ardenticatenaceae bacterium]